MTELIKLFGRAEDQIPYEVGSFALGETAGAWSRDREAILIPTLRLAPRVIRTIVSGGTLFHQLNGVSLFRGTRFERDVYSYSWGDLMVFETGEPTVTRVVLLRGKIAMPDLTTVYRYLKEMPKRGPKTA